MEEVSNEKPNQKEQMKILGLFYQITIREKQQTHKWKDSY
jgi:hypothetical protein